MKPMTCEDVKFLMPLELQSVRQLTLSVTKTTSGGICVEQLAPGFFALGSELMSS